MGLKTIWSNYRVLIVMGTGLALVHWGWYNIKSSPVFQPKRNELVPEPGIVTYVLDQEKQAKGK
ncbi:uncharacterized LOC128706665 homolog [Eublepharis macularius]|uniref:Uncharacterized LOC128706665 homolog n=1 Tax=Eublepharis macularius TaxID=481883 RepID=A0AA97LEL1_EUBMA|nr:uncharacterized LOC128706665 homolog [Eublepharis macularius]